MSYVRTMIWFGAALIFYAALFRTSWWHVLIGAGGLLIVAGLRMRARGGNAAQEPLWRKALILANIVILTLIICETFARPFISKWELGGDSIFEHHPEALYALKPNTYAERGIRLDNKKWGYYPVTISSQGLRNEELGPKAEDEFRIYMMGDSYTFGNGVRDENTIPKIVELSLKTWPLKKRVTVINGGCMGYGPWQERILFLERGLPLEPDLVIMQALPANDYSDTLARQGRVPEAYNPLDATYKLMWLHHSDWKMRAELTAQSISRLYKLYFMRSKGQFSLARLLNYTRIFHSKDFPVLPPPARRPYYIEFNLREWNRDIEDGWTAAKEDILAIADDCKSRGIDFFVYSVPLNTLMINWMWDYAMERVDDPQSYERGKDWRLSNEFFKEAALASFSLYDAIAEHPNRDQFYYANDRHFSPLGAAVLGRRIADFLGLNYFPAKGLVQKAAPPVSAPDAGEPSAGEPSAGEP